MSGPRGHGTGPGRGGRPPGGGEGDPPEEPGERPGRADAFLEPLFSDSTLWPILAVALLIFAMLLAMTLLMALRGRLAAGAALLAMVWLSIGPWRSDLRRRRLGRASTLLLVLWALGAAIAVVGSRTGNL